MISVSLKMNIPSQKVKLLETGAEALAHVVTVTMIQMVTNGRADRQRQVLLAILDKF